ncbi:MAG: TSCPD domain-containing protein [Candidatus Paraimprobicoccus trichonymphae]|uniref:ribonucleoside-diphosphate reductase n=1 Tax=Candidatus Paraimprobicoccus trichonymphae TaxID=3033793 RepID=A0AA48KY01_9FIRM|nr:MAG: TSCPD domain-containing protein [Candidatus Paraimprobicoccus trichonymphae]
MINDLKNTKSYDYNTFGTCSRKIHIELDNNNMIKDVIFEGGCSGNSNGISKLVKGMKAEEVITKLEGTKCGFRATSCPDQLSIALRKILTERSNFYVSS